MDGAEGMSSRPSRGEVLQAAAAVAVDKKAEDGRRRNATEKKKNARVAACPVERERIAQTVRNAAKRPCPDASDALDAESQRHLLHMKEKEAAERRASDPVERESIAQTVRNAAANYGASQDPEPRSLLGDFDGEEEVEAEVVDKDQEQDGEEEDEVEVVDKDQEQDGEEEDGEEDEEEEEEEERPGASPGSGSSQPRAAASSPSPMKFYGSTTYK